MAKLLAAIRPSQRTKTARESGSPERFVKNEGRALRICRYAGLLLIRRLRRAHRHAQALWQKILTALAGVQVRMERTVRIFSLRNGISLDWVDARVTALRIGFGKASEKGYFHVVLYGLRVLGHATRRGVIHLFSSANYIAPLLAAGVFAVVLGVTLHMNFALEVVYNGESIGYIADESVFEDAEKEVLKRIVLEDYIRPADTIPQFAIAIVQKDRISDSNIMTNQIIQASGNELSEATGLYIDDKFLGAVTSSASLNRVLSSVKDKYRTDAPNETVEFVKEVEQRSGLYPLTSIVDVRMLETRVSQEEAQQRIYTTVKGDAPITIAQKNGIPYSKLKALNPDIESRLMIGQEILVEKAVPMLEVKVMRDETSEVEIPFKIEYQQDTSRYQGYVSTTQKGQKGADLVTARVTYIDGVEISRETTDVERIKEPVNEKTIVGGKRPLDKMPSGAQSTSGNFIWPTDGGHVSCGFAGYLGHTGMDIGGMGQGSAVRAAASGIVTKVVYSNVGYGYHVMISHGGGVETLYGHNSKIYVKVGDWVEQGQLIAAMGRTGRATGVHVHFEIRVNGKYMNPANYIGTRCPY
ncbi:MAG: peptidoglycan DD-metalloendopeptidase family protein [Oscillospiraceae bacterium]